VDHGIFHSQFMGGIVNVFVCRDRHGNEDGFTLGGCTRNILVSSAIAWASKSSIKQNLSKNTMAFCRALIIPLSLVIVVSSSFM
jgi:hypothetical protein